MTIIAKVKATYTREIISHPERQFFIVLLSLLFNLIAFGYFGIYFGLINTITKIGLLNDYRDVQQGLSENIQKVHDLEDFIVRDTGVSLISTAVSTYGNISDYLTAFTLTSAQHGFAVNNMGFSMKNKSDQVISISTSLSGSLAQSVNVLKGIESLPRLTRVNSLSAFQDQPGNATIIINLEIFKAE